MEQKKTNQKKNPPSRSKEEKIKRYAEIGRWFQTLCLTRIPVFGFFYMLVLAIRKKTPSPKREFATAYVLYRILVMLLAITVLIILYRVGLSFIDGILQYAGD